MDGQEGKSSEDELPDGETASNQTKPEPLSYFSNKKTSPLVTLRRMRPMEADLARAKLESEGVPCFVDDQNIAQTHSFLFTEVRLQVAESDVDRATEILERPADDDADGEYADEPWRCPKCHRKSVDLMPLGTWRRWARRAFVFVLIIPLLLASITWCFPDPQLENDSRALREWGLWPWVLIVFGLGAAVLFAKRRKICRSCGYEWDAGGD
jgi:hypothetical protein